MGIRTSGFFKTPLRGVFKKRTDFEGLGIILEGQKKLGQPCQQKKHVLRTFLISDGTDHQRCRTLPAAANRLVKKNSGAEYALYLHRRGPR
jgi:hypothetical protein